MINKRISNISCDKECFDKAATDYNNALKNSCFNKNIKFTLRPPEIKRSRNILWFNPPFSCNVKSNIGKIFLQLLDKHFPKHHKYYNVKISYSCMQNMTCVIQNNNTNLEQKKGTAKQQQRNVAVNKNLIVHQQKNAYQNAWRVIHRSIGPI